MSDTYWDKPPVYARDLQGVSPFELFDDPDLTYTWPDGWGWTRRRTVIPFIRKYAIEIVAAIGYITTIATALGLQHQHYVAVVLGVLSTIAVVLTKFFTVTKPARAASNSRPARS